MTLEQIAWNEKSTLSPLIDVKIFGHPDAEGLPYADAMAPDVAIWDPGGPHYNKFFQLEGKLVSFPRAIYSKRPDYGPLSPLFAWVPPDRGKEGINLLVIIIIFIKATKVVRKAGARQSHVGSHSKSFTPVNWLWGGHMPNKFLKQFLADVTNILIQFYHIGRILGYFRIPWAQAQGEY